MITLVPSQMPQQDIGMIAQVLMGQGFVQQPASERKRESPAIVFYTEDKTNVVTMKFYQDIGTLRVETRGELSDKIALALGQYMEALSVDKISELFNASQSDMERRIYAILLVLAFHDASEAMLALHDTYITHGNDATREGIIQGLAFLETPDVGQALEAIEAEFKGQPVADLCRKGIDALSARGLIRESLGSFLAKIRTLIDANAKDALERIDKYCDNNPDAPALRALKARALTELGRTDEAAQLLAQIDVSDPDAPEAFCERAKLREASHFIDQAYRDIQCAMACDPQNEEAQLVFRRLSMLANQKESSDEEKLADYTHALEANPEDANLLCQRADCLLRLGEFDKARGDALHARKLTPNDPRLPLILGKAYLGMGWLGSALEQASLAQKTFVPTQRLEASLLKVRVFMAINRLEQARHALRELASELHDEPAVKLYAALIEELLGNDDSARAGYAELSPGSLDDALRSEPPVLYQDAPILRSFVKDAVPAVRDALKATLDQEPADPYFKRCDSCGALTMARRTYCKECSGSTFFE